MESWLLAQQIEMEAIKTEVQGMIAENQYRIGLGQGIAYGNGAFQEKADELRAIAVRIIDTDYYKTVVDTQLDPLILKEELSDLIEEVEILQQQIQHANNYLSGGGCGARSVQRAAELWQGLDRLDQGGERWINV